MEDQWNMDNIVCMALPNYDNVLFIVLANNWQLYLQMDVKSIDTLYLYWIVGRF